MLNVYIQKLQVKGAIMYLVDVLNKNGYTTEEKTKEFSWGEVPKILVKKGNVIVADFLPLFYEFEQRWELEGYNHINENIIVFAPETIHEEEVDDFAKEFLEFLEEDEE